MSTPTDVVCSFFAEGTPRPQGSKRHVGQGRMIEMSKGLPGWRATVVAAARSAYPGAAIEGPVAVTALFIFPRAKALKDNPAPPHTCRPDVDKVSRAVLDALTDAGVYGDDSQVVSLLAMKRRARPGETPGADVTVRRVDEEHAR